MPLEFYSEETIKSFEYTKDCYYNIEETIDKEDFEDKDADEIFKMLRDKMEIVDFADHLKRYVYLQGDIDLPFEEVTNDMYKKAIIDSFEQNMAPYNFERPVNRHKVVSRWLNGTISRRAIFVLAFGLKMTAKDAEEFLTKVIKERGFNFTDVNETLYWYCLRKREPYVRVLELMRECEGSMDPVITQEKWLAFSQNPKQDLYDEQNLKEYVTYLMRNESVRDEQRTRAYREFLRLYDECRRLIAENYYDEDEKQVQSKPVEEVGAGDLERYLYSGIARDENGNITTVKKKSDLVKYLSVGKLTRQRISRVLRENEKDNDVNRFDLITLNFFIYSEKEYYDQAQINRCDDFIDDMDEILEGCGFYKLYPVNPYELLILMCLVSVAPMEAFAEVFSRVYDENGKEEA